MAEKFNDFSLPANGYAAFDALSLKGLIVSRLNQSNIFTDQNFEGSNISAIIDIIAYSYHTLLFYLNRTGAESTFTTAELYENINKIVKLIGYNPIGNQTSILPFLANANEQLPPETYTIPRYSYFTINGTYYSFNQDVTFTKPNSGAVQLTDLQDNNLLYQGIFTEYPSYIATGEPFEVITMVVVDNNNNNITIDHFNTEVYVKDNTALNPVWEKWTSTQSLFLERSNALRYEIRLNENERYEIKFGNNVNGKRLNPDDEVAIYYLKSNGPQGEVGPGLLNNNQLFFFSSNRFNQIKTDTTPINLNIISRQQAQQITFSNIDPSTPFTPREPVTDIKNNATNTFRSQYRLITTDDYENYVKRNYSNIIGSIKVANNWDYISGHQKYFFDLGLDKPNLNSRVLFNQVKFADACNFNNVYIYAVPRLEKLTSLTTRANYLNAAQKQLISNDLYNIKLTTAETIINDPVYVTVDVGVRAPGESLAPSISDNSYIEITRDVTAKRNPQTIKQQVYEIFRQYFATTNDNLGSLISLTNISNSILALEGVTDVNTKRVENGITYTAPGISILIYNPVYPYDDIQVTSQDVQLPYFKFPFLNNLLDFASKVRVVTPSIQTLQKEY
jgi:hypothetical protein